MKSTIIVNSKEKKIQVQNAEIGADASKILDALRKARKSVVDAKVALIGISFHSDVQRAKELQEHIEGWIYSYENR